MFVEVHKLKKKFAEENFSSPPSKKIMVRPLVTAGVVVLFHPFFFFSFFLETSRCCSTMNMETVTCLVAEICRRTLVHREIKMVNLSSCLESFDLLNLVPRVSLSLRPLERFWGRGERDPGNEDVICSLCCPTMRFAKIRRKCT